MEVKLAKAIRRRSPITGANETLNVGQVVDLSDEEIKGFGGPESDFFVHEEEEEVEIEELSEEGGEPVKRTVKRKKARK